MIIKSNWKSAGELKSPRQRRWQGEEGGEESAGVHDKYCTNSGTHETLSLCLLISHGYNIPARSVYQNTSMQIIHAVTKNLRRGIPFENSSFKHNTAYSLCIERCFDINSEERKERILYLDTLFIKIECFENI